jgi:hypothetical protein
MVRRFTLRRKLASTTAPPPKPDVDLETLAVHAGEAWADRCAGELRSQRRPVVGAWPGTMTEARSWVLATMAARGSRELVSIDRLRALSRTAYGAARTAWRAVAEKDVEL